ncbi:MAG: HAMP domain-containing histidine kinase [Desulfuromonadales bacterium]|nr:HAMP domain-containing histidine kinase [Desulfuromonadales bacterium]
MSSGFPKKRVDSTIGFRIAAGCSLLVLLSSLALMAIAYWFLASTLAHHDREQVLVELQSLRGEYLEGGIDAFIKAVQDNDRFRRNNPFFTRIANGSEESGRVFFPQYWREFDLTVLDKPPLPRTEDGWIILPAHGDNHHLEILETEFPDGFRFQIGTSTEDRGRVLKRLRETFFISIVPLIILGLAGGFFLARRSMRPVQDLIRTAESIREGEWDVRVSRTGNGDELDDLGRLFNEMIEKINALIRGMKQALDSVAHDLRTPMTRFRNRAERALQEGDPQLALQECVEQSEQILGMLNMLMDISEAESGTLHLNLREVDFTAMVDNVAEMYLYVAEEKGIVFESVIEPQLRMTLDPERTSQALANLLDNAVKNTPPGGRIDLVAKSAGEGIQVRVADNGIGIHPADLDHIWDRLFRGRNQSEKGIGLGLSLVRAVVAAHGGTITACNRPEGGALFEMSLPRR